MRFLLCIVASLAAHASAASGQIVRGQVVDSISNIPLSAAAVYLLDADGSTAGQTTTDANGLFLIHAPGPARYRLHVERTGYRASTFPVFFLAEGELLSYQLLLPRAGGTPVEDTIDAATIVSLLCPADSAAVAVPIVTGTTFDAVTGEALSGVRVLVTGTGLPDTLAQRIDLPLLVDTLVTDADGVYAICGVLYRSTMYLIAEQGDLVSQVVTLKFWGRGVTLGWGYRDMNTRVLEQHLAMFRPAQRTLSVQGTVTDTSGAGLAGVEVRVLGTGRATRTDASGVFHFQDLPPGAVRLQARQIGYGPQVRDVILDRDDARLDEPIQMESTPVRLAPIVVEGEPLFGNPHMAGFYRRRRSSGTGSFVTMTDYVRRWGKPVRPLEMVATMRGVRMRRVQTAYFDDAVATAVGPSVEAPFLSRCDRPPSIYLDGMYLGRGGEIDIDGWVSTQWLAAIEIHPRGAPIEIGYKGPYGKSCGAILFWTVR